MNRTSQQIKRDMLEWAKHHLDIRASDEWGYDVIDADPLVHLLIGACAAEAKSVYDAIQESDDRLQQRLLRYLLPEAFLYPRPAYGILRAQPIGSTCQLTPYQEFKVKAAEKTFSFCPLFETTLLGGAMRFIGLGSRIIERQPGSPYLSDTGAEQVSKILLGIESKQPIASLERVALYFDWRGSSAERQAFLLALSNSRWLCNGLELNHQVGLVPGSALISEQFSAESRLTRQVAAQYRLNFHVVIDETLGVPEKRPARDVLADWLGEQAGPDTKGHFTWIRIDLPHPVLLTDAERNLIIDLNHFPVVNRRMKRKADQSTYFSKSLGFEAVAIQPDEGYFCGIESVVNQETGEEIPPMVFSHLVSSGEAKPGYALRFGGMGRSDSLNAWERLSYLLGLFRQEHKDREVIEELGLKMTLEELHEALGKRILKGLSTKTEKDRSTPVYLYFKVDPSQKVDTEIRYWITDGEEANRIPAGAMLYAEPPIAGLAPASPKLAVETTGGKTAVPEIELNQILQNILFSRERIVTAHDIKSLCRKLLGEHLLEVKIESLFEPDPNGRQGGIQRVIGVFLTVDQADDVRHHQTGQEIEWILRENSVGTIPYRVKIC